MHAGTPDGNEDTSGERDRAPDGRHRPKGFLAHQLGQQPGQAADLGHEDILKYKQSTCTDQAGKKELFPKSRGLLDLTNRAEQEPQWHVHEDPPSKQERMPPPICSREARIGLELCVLVALGRATLEKRKL